jgi:hypothetical protein
MESDAKSLWGIERANDHVLGQTRKPAVLLLDPQIVPTHEHMFAYREDRTLGAYSANFM